MSASKAMLLTQAVLLAVTAVIVFGVSRKSVIKVEDTQSRLEDAACYKRDSRSTGCETSFERLMSGRVTAGAESVRVVGYLAVRNGVPLLFSDERSYRHDIIVNAIAIKGSLKDFEVLGGHWYTYVRVKGIFKDSKDMGPEPWFGELRPPLSVSEVKDVVQESPEDLRVNIEFVR